MIYDSELISIFWNRVDRKSPEECWPWLSYISDTGYGQICRYGIRLKAHRVAYELTYGEILDSRLCLHKCDNRKCCNPAHLYIGTHKDNMRDRQLRYKGPYLGGKDRKFTDEDILAMQKLSKSGKRQIEIANLFGLSRGHVSDLLRKRISVGLDNDLAP